MPTLAELHRHSVTDWQRIFATQPEATVAWIRLAARSGFKAAQLVLGQMHLDGRGVPRDEAAAYGWFTKAAALGSAEARNMVGRCHELGWGVPVDQATALAHYRKASQDGSAWGAYNLGCLLLYGVGVPRNHAGALAAFRSAADRNHAKAMGMLGRCLEEGWGTDVDRHGAAAWYERAARGGDCWGAFNLGLIRAEAGRSDEAVALLDRAVATATPNCLGAIADVLTPHADPRLRHVGLIARAMLSPSIVDRSEIAGASHAGEDHPLSSARSRSAASAMRSVIAVVVAVRLALLVKSFRSHHC